MNRFAITVIGIVIVFSGGASVKAQSGALYCRICHQFFSDENSYLAHMRSHDAGRSGNSNSQSSGPSASQIAAQQAAAAQQQAAAEQRAQEEQEQRDADAEAAAKKAAHDAEVARQFREGREALSQLRGLSQDSNSTDSGYKGLNDTNRDLAGFRTLPDVNTDPNVVDGRTQPSGLPKFVDDAIASGYAGSPPGVSENVRKGFQAIAAHQWNVAKAWFGTALNHDPNNAGLKRLVELADHTEKYIQQGNTGKSRNSSSPREPMQLPKDSDVEFLFPGLPAIEAKEMNDYIIKWALEATAKPPEASHPTK